MAKSELARLRRDKKFLLALRREMSSSQGVAAVNSAIEVLTCRIIRLCRK